MSLGATNTSGRSAEESHRLGMHQIIVPFSSLARVPYVAELLTTLITGSPPPGAISGSIIL